ncbi:MAG TPA: lipid-binding SYLF domain-containing protein [Terriglobales bacterium]|nr:lipid-binding SYLF domain-containing protein [Terriglobales bacterium]
MKHKSLVFVSVLLISSAMAFAQGDRSKAVGRVEEAGNVINEIMAAPDHGIPSNVIESAQCVAIVPSYLKAAFGFSGTYGRGVASCRTGAGWSAPAFFSLKGGGFGFQIGGQAIDLIMLVMNREGMQALLSSKFKLGGDVSVAAGPVGREAEATTDWKMRAEVLTYSRARGVFAGVALNGALIRQDASTTRDFYGHMIPFKTLLTGNTPAPQDSQTFLGALRKYAGEDGNTPAKAETPAATKPPSGRH